MIEMYLKLFLLITIYTFGIGYGLFSTFFTWLPWGLLPGTLTIILIHLMRIPQPPNAQLERIIGIDPCNESSDNNNALVKTVAHRGAGLDVPENSLTAFKQCSEKGCKFIEFDICLTKDKVPVIFHDENLRRMSNDSRVIRQSTKKELDEVDISVNHPFSDRFKDTRIPTLDEAIKQMLADGQRMFIDIKECDSRMVNVILDLFKKCPELYDKAVVTTFFPNIIYQIRKSNPQIVCSMAYRPYFYSHESYNFPEGKGPARCKRWLKHWALCILDTVHAWALPRITYYMLGLSIILLHKDTVSPQSIKQWRDKGVRPCIWTVNLPDAKRYVSKILKCTYLTDTLTGEENIHS